ncbi:DNA-binding domain-containing protein [Pararhodobacter oceanensis]|uniref:HvfC/BufC N-terminal domain-containing protein n=1 Tax=Pararhodobacter oceanensis TaxID=2172121 RepID=UPI003A8E7DAE
MSAPRDTHAAMQARFHAALWTTATPDGLAQTDAVERRFLVYRNNVQHGLCSALSQRFPVVERLVGAEFFTAMGRAFAASHPPQTPVMIDWGAEFARFIEAFPPAAGLPYLGDVARLEWARGLAYHAADAPVADPAMLSRGDPSGLRLTLAPSVVAFGSAWPVVSIWANNQPGAEAQPLPTGAEFALIARLPAFEVPVIPLQAADCAVLRELHAGRSLGEAAGHGDPTRILALLLKYGLITAIKGETL